MEENKEKKPEMTTNGSFSSFEKVMDVLGKYGPLKTIYGIIMFLFFSFAVYIATNPGVVFERYSQYVSEKHNAARRRFVKTGDEVNQSRLAGTCRTYHAESFSASQFKGYAGERGMRLFVV